MASSIFNHQFQRQIGGVGQAPEIGCDAPPVIVAVDPLSLDNRFTTPRDTWISAVLLRLDGPDAINVEMYLGDARLWHLAGRSSVAPGRAISFRSTFATCLPAVCARTPTTSGAGSATSLSSVYVRPIMTRGARSGVYTFRIAIVAESAQDDLAA